MTQSRKCFQAVSTTPAPTRSGAERSGADRCGAVRCGAVRCGAVRCGAVRCGLTLLSSGRLTAPLNSNVRLRNTNAGNASVVVNAPSRATCSAHVSVGQGSCEPGRALRRIAALLHLVNGWRFAPACCAAQSGVAWRRARATVAPVRLASRGGATNREAAARAKENSLRVLPPLVHAS
jgi:hypothetical protein